MPKTRSKILDRILAPITSRSADQTVKLTDSNIRKWLGLGTVHNVTPIVVNVGSAMSVPAFFSAVSFLSGTLAGLPVHVYETKISDGTRKKSKRPIANVVGKAVNPALTSFEWRRLVMQHILKHGRHVSYLDRNKATREVENIVPIAPGSYTVKGDAYNKQYEVRTRDGKKTVYEAEDVIDLVFDFTDDMLHAQSPLQGAANAIGLFIAATKYGSKVFENGGLPPLVVEGPFATSEAAQRAGDDIPRALSAKANGSQALVMPLGHKVSSLGFKADEMQLTELKRFCVEEVARVFSLPPVFLQDLANGVRSDSEQQDLHFVKHTLRRWTEQIEAELNLKLFGRENKKYHVEFNLDGILRGDFKTRMEGFSKAVASGLITPNEARALDNRPPVEGGDVAYIQGAMMPLKTQQNAELKNQPDKKVGGSDGSTESEE